MAAERAACIGIDLGTTNSCVGVWKNDKVEIIANDQGARTTPSWVAFAGDERLVGQAAVNQAAMNPANTVHDSKRLIGRRFNDPEVQADIKHLAFNVVEVDAQPVVSVEADGKELRLTPEEVGAMILTKMKETAESYLGSEVTDAVITVPAYFNDAQRQATKDAGVIAGLNVLRIINEPTAAAVAYGLDRSAEEGEEKVHTVLIFDLGGGTFDVSLLAIEGGLFTVLATAGNTHLGGEDFDRNMVIYCAEEFKRKNKGADISKSPRALRRLRSACEAAKRQLSSQMSTVIEVDSIMDGLDLSVRLSRAKFESLNEELFKSTLTPVEQVLKDAGRAKASISEVVLVGGSTRIPKIQSLLQNYFEGRTLNKSINPDEAVAYGAAVQAAIMTGATNSMTEELLLLDVTPLSLGVETTGGVMNVLIKRNTTIPCKGQGQFTIDFNGQTEMPVEVYQGERPNVEGNFKLGEFLLKGIAPNQKKGDAEILVTMSIDSDGILTVSAMDKASRNKSSVAITNNTGRLTKEEIERMVGDQKKMAAEDRAMKAKLELRRELESACYDTRDLMDSEIADAELSAEMAALKLEVDTLIDGGLEFLDANPDAAADEFRAQRHKLVDAYEANMKEIRRSLNKGNERRRGRGKR